MKYLAILSFCFATLSFQGCSQKGHHSKDHHKSAQCECGKDCKCSDMKKDGKKAKCNCGK